MALLEVGADAKLGIESFSAAAARSMAVAEIITEAYRIVVRVKSKFHGRC
jgi:hypothetical protein